jgi:hypothetical protein
MKETTCVLVPEDEYWEMKEKAIKFDVLREEALRHPEHLTECVRALCGIEEGGKEKDDGDGSDD